MIERTRRTWLSGALVPFYSTPDSKLEPMEAYVTSEGATPTLVELCLPERWRDARHLRDAGLFLVEVADYYTDWKESAF